jgi:pyruvate dehydrogenase E1 component beta subunit
MKFSEAIDRALADAMEKDERIVVIGEDVHGLRTALFAQFGKDRVLSAPISESAFVGAAVGAAMAGLRPVVEIMMVDFIGSCLDAVLNHMSKVDAFSGGKWNCPVVVRTSCGGGYGDGGQHAQALWSMFAAIPGLTVVVPSTPDDAYGLMASALQHDGPVIFFEHKLISETWLELLGRGGRRTVSFDVPADAVEGEVSRGQSVPIGRAIVRRPGSDLTIASLALGVHRALEAAEQLSKNGIEAEVIDLRTVRPLDLETVRASVARTGRLLAVDEDYKECGLSGELAAAVLESGIRCAYRRVCVDATLPFARALETAAMPNTGRIVEAARSLV